MDLPITLISKLLDQHQANWLHIYLRDYVDWQQDVYNFSGRKVNAPRLTALYGTDYAYSGLNKIAVPFDVVFNKLLALIKERTNQTFNSALLNYYRTGKDSIGMHSDDEPELGVAPVVHSLSLGASRDMVFKNKKTRTEEVVQLNHGDYLLMHSGCQQEYHHGIPKDFRCHGERISITLRNINN
jgi:alkylated DNA repair dioxygenase AlkB